MDEEERDGRQENGQNEGEGRVGLAQGKRRRSKMRTRICEKGRGVRAGRMKDAGKEIDQKRMSE